jgi:lysophospholipase L1-like esterase
VNSPAREGLIIAFGDSLTAGFGAPPDQSYPAHLARILHREIINRGVNGDTAQHGLERLDRDVLSQNPAIVLVCFGGNDLLQRRPIEDCFSCIEEIIRRIQATGALVVLVGIRGSWLYNIDYETPYRELAIRTGCPLVPSVLDGIWGVPWLMSDVAHPNARGYRIIAKRVAVKLLTPENAPRGAGTKNIKEL